MGGLEGKRPLGRPRCRQEANNKMDLQEVGWRGKNWIDQLQDWDRWRALVNVTVTSGLHKMRRIS